MALGARGIIDHFPSFTTVLRKLTTLWTTTLRSLTNGFRSCVRNLTTGPDFYPPTDKQQETHKQTFIDSICKDAICSLASRYNNGRPCQIFDSKSGSFNACFFVEFPQDGTKWVVRIPIENAVEDVWDKVQSEVATMRYIQSKTMIPIPQIYAFGQGEALLQDKSTLLAYLVLEYMPGQSLDIQAFTKDTRERRNYFYSQLIDILAQMRGLELPAAGSLRLDPSGGPYPILGPYRSIQLAELHMQDFRAVPTPVVLKSMADFVRFQLEIAKAIFKFPVSGQALDGVQNELFALDYIQRELNRITGVNGLWHSGPFVLTNLDLRWSNIIVDDDLNIRAVIDWEWTCSIPSQIFMPPTWIAGKEPAFVTGVEYRDEFPHFHRILQSQSSKSDAHQQLAKDWDLDLPNRTEFAIAEILRHQHELPGIFYEALFPKYFEGTKKEVVAAFFAQEKNEGLALQARQQWERSERYTQYLKDNGLFMPDPQVEYLRELDRKIQEILNRK